MQFKKESVVKKKMANLGGWAREGNKGDEHYETCMKMTMKPIIM